MDIQQGVYYWYFFTQIMTEHMQLRVDEIQFTAKEKWIIAEK